MSIAEVTGTSVRINRFGTGGQAVGSRNRVVGERFKVHEDVSEVCEAGEQVVLDAVADAVAVGDGPGGRDLDVDIDQVLETGLADVELIDLGHAFDRSGGLSNRVDELLLGLLVHEFAGTAA